MTIRASIESASNANWFRIDLTAGTTYDFATGGLPGTTVFSLVKPDEAGDFAAPVSTDPVGVPNVPNGFNYTADATGTYYISLRDIWDDFTGPYALSAVVVPNSYTLVHPGNLVVGGNINAAVESAGNANWFKITLTAGTTYAITAAGLPLTAGINLYAAADASDEPAPLGIISGLVGDSTVGLNFTADTTGTYYVLIRDEGDYTGTYTVSAKTVTNSYTLAHPGLLTAGATLHPSIESPNDANWFKIDLTAGTTYNFTTTGLPAYAQLQLHTAADAADEPAALADYPPFQLNVASGLNFTADTTGTYYLSVRDFADNFTGAYTVSAAVVPDTYTLLHPGNLAIGGTLHPSIESANDANWFKVSLTAGTTYNFTTTGLPINTMFELFNAADASDFALPLATTPPVALNVASGLNFTADTTGNYYLLVRDYADNFTGAYTVSAAVVPNSYTLTNPGILGIGATLHPSVESPNDANWFKVSLTAGTTYNFTTTGLPARAQLQLHAAADAANEPTPLAGAAPFQLDVASGLNFTADTTGTYYLSVRDFDDNFTGAYTVSAAVVPDTYTLAHPGNLTVGSTLHPSVESANDANWFKVNLTAGTTYTFTTTGLPAGATFEIVPSADASDVPVALAANAPFLSIATATLNFTADTTGFYYVHVRDFADNFTGAYTLSAAVVANSYTLAQPGILTLGNSLIGTSGADTLIATLLPDVITGAAGNDTIDGGAGNDVAVYAATRANSTVTHDAVTHTWTVASAADGTDTVKNVEQYQFANGLYSFQFATATNVLANFGGQQGWTSQATNQRLLADVNGDGNMDIVGFGFSAVRVALGNGDGTFQAAKIGVANFGPAQDWNTQDHYPRLLADVNGDGRADIVGFGYAGTFISLGQADGTFGATQLGIANFGGQLGWNSQNVNLRLVADVNGDGKADILGFGFSAVRVALGNGDGTFQAAKIGIADFGPSLGWTNQDQYSRQLADVDGDGKLDLVGFGGGAVFTALGNGDGTFQASHIALADMSTALGWTSQSAFPRVMADVNGDGRADIIGFGYGGASVALARADGTFNAASLAVAGFGAAQGWTTQDTTPRYLTDINHDGKLDILGFGPDGTAIAYGNGDGTFTAVSKDLANFGNAQGWTSNDNNLHQIADLNGDGLPDVLGFAFAGVKVAMNQGDVVL